MKFSNGWKMNPNHFQPNVIMRPLYQEKILPNIAYIGGPGEVAYWLQLKDIFSFFEIPFPVVVLRDSALLLHEKLNEKKKKPWP